MKKYYSIYVVVFLFIISVILGGCATTSKTQELAELEKTRQQMQQQMANMIKESQEARESALKYYKLSEKYQNLLASKNRELLSLENTYSELNNKDMGTAKEVIKDKLIEEAQASVHLQKRLKRYTTKAQLYKEKSQHLEEQVKQTQEEVQKTDQKIQEIKQELASEQQNKEKNKDNG